MMVSDFIVLVSHLVNMSITNLIVVAIVSTILGTITYKVVTGIRGSVTLSVASLVRLFAYLRAWESGETFWGFLLTVSVVVVGHELYRRLVGAYR
jgi:hypothetical protein